MEASFGLWLRKRRKALDLTREELAQKIGCSVSALRKVEAEERRPSKQLAELLASALNIPADELPAFIRIARGGLSTARMRVPPPLHDLSQLQQPQTYSPNIPVPPTPLIGRETELSALRQMLADPQCRLVTLTGPGGIGKTRLAMELAHDQSGAFSDGAAFVSLAGVDSPSLLLPAVADALKLPLHQGAGPGEQLLDHLRKKRMLLVLDNMEHLLEGAGLLAELNQVAPFVKILCTSREPLSLRGEWIFEIRGLKFPEGEKNGKPEDYSAIALFAQSARRAKAGFALAPEDWPDIVRICRMVEGMPLAIELAASWVRSLSCHDIAEEIDRSLDFLSSSMRDMPERHRSMRAVFDHSWRLLSEKEQRALSGLTVFCCGFTHEAAEQVAGADLDLLFALAAKSLVQRSGENRFSLHELVVQYGARQLTAGETGEVRGRHVTFFTGFAETGRQLTAGWLKRMEQEDDNLRAALDYAVAMQATGMALRLGAVMWLYWEHHGSIDEGRRWLKAVLALPGADTDDHALQRAKVLIAAGSLARIQGDFAQARELYEESLAVRRKAGDVAGMASSLNSLGVLAMFEGQYARAEAFFQESLRLCRELGTPAEVVKRLNNLGVVAMYQGEYEKARLLHEESMALYRELNDRHGIAGSLGNLGDVLRYQGRYGRAMHVLEESRAIFDEMRDVHGLVITLGSIARVHMAKGDVDQALAAFHTSLERNREVGDKTELATNLEGIAGALSMHAGGSPESQYETRLAVRLLATACQLRLSVGAPLSAAEHQEVGRITSRLQAGLSPDEYALESRRGAEMPAGQAVEVALCHLSQILNAEDASWSGPVDSPGDN